MPKIDIKIKGMHCRSCEILVGDKLKEIPGVKKVEVSYHKSEAAIFTDREIPTADIERAINDAGYEVGSDAPKPWITTDPQVFKDLFFALIILASLYFVIKATGFKGFNFGSLAKPSNLLVVLLIGLTAGFSTCMALVGGLVLGISARHAEKHPEATPAQKFRPHLFFNLGRILSFFILGGLIGLLGQAFQLSGSVLGLMTMAVGIIMLLLGLQLTELFPRLSNGIFTLPSSVSRLLGIKKHHEKEYSHLNSSLVGALTFFLPCGFTQAMQLFAMTTGNFWSGAAVMGFFALGTTPGLLGIGGLTSIIKGALARKFFKFVGLTVVFLGLFNLSNGSNLLGWRFTTSRAATNSPTNVSLINGVQVVKMDQLSNGYKPNNFTVKQGIPVKWIINSRDPGSCAASLYAQKLNVRKFLQAGENIIEFTPTETDRIQFSCSMGMYRGWFDVIAGESTQNTQNGNQTSEPADKPLSPDTQVIKAVYTYNDDIQPKQFSVKANLPVRLEIEAKDDGYGCMASVAVPGLVQDFDYLEKGKTLKFDFTPTKAGSYYITCAMGSPRGIIKVE